MPWNRSFHWSTKRRAISTQPLALHSTPTWCGVVWCGRGSHQAGITHFTVTATEMDGDVVVTSAALASPLHLYSPSHSLHFCYTTSSLLSFSLSSLLLHHFISTLLLTLFTFATPLHLYSPSHSLHFCYTTSSLLSFSLSSLILRY